MPLEDSVAPRLNRLSDGDRRKLTMAVVRDLRAANAASIRDLQPADGEAWIEFELFSSISS